MAKFDIYEAVTERITQQLQQGVIPWKKPWTGTQTALSAEQPENRTVC